MGVSSRTRARGEIVLRRRLFRIVCTVPKTRINTPLSIPKLFRSLEILSLVRLRFDMIPSAVASVQQSLEKRRPKGGRSRFVASILNDPATRFERQASGLPRQAKVDETKARNAEMIREAKMVDLESARLV